MKQASLFSILILAANLLMISRYGTDVPFWDQWDSEASLYIKWEEGTLTLADMVKPHVQHRFAVSRMLLILTYELRGGWSPVTNMIAQSLLVPLLFLAFFRFVRGRIAARWRQVVFYGTAAAVFICPFYWEVMLMGFQSHFYLSLVFGLLLIQLAAHPPSGVTSFWFAVVGLVNTVTSASCLIPLVVCLVIQLIALAGFRQWRQNVALVMIGVTVLLIWLNSWLLVSPVEQQSYGANGLFDLVWLSLQAFSWPVEYVGILGLWIIPLALVGHAYRAWTGSGFKAAAACVVRDRASLAIFAFLLWLILSIGSIAYARGHYALFVSRYLNIYAFTLFVPFLLYLLFFDNIQELRLRKHLSRFLVLVYCVLAVGLGKELVQEFARCRQYKTDMEIVKANLVAALQQNSPQILFEQQKIKAIYGAHPAPAKVFQVMNHPALHGKLLWLPERLRNPGKKGPS